MKNKYAYRSRLSEAKTRHIVRCFAADLTALQAAEMTGANRNTINRVYRALRERIFSDCEKQRVAFVGANHNRPPYVPGGATARGDRDGAIVFGIFEREGQVYTELVAEASRPVLRNVIRGKTDVSTVAITDEWPGYHGLVDLSHGHFRVDRPGDERPVGRVQINGIEGFWGLAKVRFAKFKGVPAQTFHLHLKETEWRYNHRAQDKYELLLAYLRREPVI